MEDAGAFGLATQAPTVLPVAGDAGAVDLATRAPTVLPGVEEAGAVRLATRAPTDASCGGGYGHKKSADRLSSFTSASSHSLSVRNVLLAVQPTHTSNLGEVLVGVHCLSAFGTPHGGCCHRKTAEEAGTMETLVTR